MCGLRPRGRIAYEPKPVERPGRPKNRRKNITYFRTYFFSQKSQKYVKKGYQKVSKRVSLFRGWRPWGRLGRHNLIFDVKDGPKVLQRCPKVSQKWCQSAPRDQKILKKMIPSQRWKMSLNVPPQKRLAFRPVFEHFWWENVRHNTKFCMIWVQARRTARSAFNKCYNNSPWVAL